MTGRDGKYQEPRPWIKDRMVTKVFDLFVGWFFIAVVLSSLSFISEGFRNQVKDIWDSPQTIRLAAEVGIENKEKLRGLDRKVSILSQPKEIFEVSIRNSGPIEGFCVEKEPCTIRVRVRRVEEAASCKLVPNVSSWGFIDPKTDTFTGAERLDKPLGRNLGSQWSFTDVTVRTPEGLAPESDFVFEASYTNCPGMEPTDEPIKRQSRPIPVEVRTSRS